jgi:putative transposase
MNIKSNFQWTVKAELDNIFIERLWSSFKYEHVYLYSAEEGNELYIGCIKWFYFNNTERPH